jgi:hypothetical protein
MAKVGISQIWLYTRYGSDQRKTLSTWLPTGIYHLKIEIWNFWNLVTLSEIFHNCPSYQGLFFDFYYKRIGEFPPPPQMVKLAEFILE